MMDMEYFGINNKIPIHLIPIFIFYDGYGVFWYFRSKMVLLCCLFIFSNIIEFKHFKLFFLFLIEILIF
jgi:hypothetical protein